MMLKTAVHPLSASKISSLHELSGVLTELWQGRYSYGTDGENEAQRSQETDSVTQLLFIFLSLLSSQWEEGAWQGMSNHHFPED